MTTLKRSSDVSSINQSIFQNRNGLNYILREDDELSTAFVVIPPDGGWGWFIVGAAFISNMIVDGSIYSLGLYLNQISKTFHIPETKVAIASSILNGFYYLSGPIVCSLINQFGYRTIGIYGGIIAAVGFLISSIIQSYTLFLLFYGMICGIGCGMIYVASVVTVGYYFEKWRALATSIAVTGSSAGVVCYPLLVKVLYRFDWKIQFKILSVFFFVTSCCAISYYPPNPITLDADGIMNLNKSNKKKVYNEPTTSILSSNYEKQYSSVPSIFVMAVREESVSSFIRNSKWETQSSRISIITEENIGRNSNKCLMCCKKLRCCANHSKQISHRPMYRTDIFYSGSLITLPEYTSAVLNSRGTRSSNIDYHISVSRTPTKLDMKERRYCCICCCPESMKTILSSMFDFSLLKSPSFLLFSLSGFLSLVALYVPYLYSVKRAEDLNIDKNIAMYLIPVLGGFNGIGRVFIGLLSSIPNLEALTVTYVSIIISGVVTIIAVYANDIYGQFCFVAIYGMSIAALSTLKSIIIVNMIGLDKLTNAFGILMMFNGVASLISLPFAGLIATKTNSLDYSYLSSGIIMLISGLILLPMNKIVNWEKSKRANSIN